MQIRIGPFEVEVSLPRGITVEFVEFSELRGEARATKVYRCHIILVDLSISEAAIHKQRSEGLG